MSTNYYLVKNRPSHCPPIHIGHSAFGWLFLFQTQEEYWHDPPVVWHNYEEVKQTLHCLTVETGEYAIVDEYDKLFTYDAFIDLVESIQNDPHCRSNPENFWHCSNVDGYRFLEGGFL